MSKIRSSRVPLAYFDSIRSSWEEFAKDLTPHSYLRELFLSNMEMFDQAFDNALLIDSTTIDAYLENLCSSFPDSEHEKIEGKFLELLSQYSAKIKLAASVRPMHNLKIVQSENTWKILKKGSADVVEKLLIEMDLLDDNKTPLVKQGKGTTLFAVIDAIKDNQTLLTRKNFTDPELLSAFNEFFGTSFKQLKRNGTTFQTDKTRAASMLKNLLK